MRVAACICDGVLAEHVACAVVRTCVACEPLTENRDGEMPRWKKRECIAGLGSRTYALRLQYKTRLAAASKPGYPCGIVALLRGMR